MNEIKFLTDGRKVVVIGNLNAQEKIVQEVFVTASGQEIPSGENFVVKSLHDEPVMTYKEKREKEIERQLKELEEKLKEKQKKYHAFDAMVEKPRNEIKKCLEAMSIGNEERYQTLINFISGKIKYVVFAKYGNPEVKTYEDFLDYIVNRDTDWSGNERFDGLRLVSLFGGSNGNISYKINRYGDGSGSSEEVYPAKDEEEVKTILSEIIGKKEVYRDDTVKLLREYNLFIDKDKYKKYYLEKERCIANNIETAENDIKKKEQFIKEENERLAKFRDENEKPVD